jgi:hypothetical protein
MEYHNFSVDTAVELGVEKAIILQKFVEWRKLNAANGVNNFDGEYWFLVTREGFCTLFPYYNWSKIRRLLKPLEEEDYVKTAEYNGMRWYTVTLKTMALVNGE